VVQSKKQNKNTRQQNPEKVCLKCNQSKSISMFYTSYDENLADRRIPYCKSCLKNGTNMNDIESVKATLKMINRPFIEHIYITSLEDEKDSFGSMMKNLALPQYRKLTWEDSVFNDDVNKIKESLNNNDDFIITKEMIIKWGNGFSKDQYMMLEDLYQNLFNSFDINNRSQEEYLKTACLYQLRNIEAIRQGNAQEATKWGNLFDSYMASGKLKPNQLSETDKMGGVTNFATFFQFIEKSNDFIPTFPDLIIDDIDYAIFMFINYNRELMGLPKITLGEIKNFMTYDYQKGQSIIFPNLSEFNEGDKDGVV
jgi:hypothetical protein